MPGGEKLRKIHPTVRPPEAENDTAPIPTAAEENVLAELHDKTAAHAGRAHQAVAEDLERVHADIEKCQCLPLFRKYVAGEIPTLDRMFANLGLFLADLSKEIESEKILIQQGEPKEYLEELQKVHGLLSGREQQVRGAIQRYVSAVIRFRNLARLSVGGVRDVNKQYVEADHARRRAHDNLIESLSVYAGQVSLAIEQGYPMTFGTFPFVQWTIGSDARDIASNKTVIFSGDVLRHRDFIRDWAIVADFVEQLKLLGDEDFLQSMRDRP